MSGEASSAEVTPEAAGDRQDWVEFVRFQLGDDSYGLELGRVQRILRNPTVTDVPQTGPAIAGVTNLGGEMPVVIEGRELLGLPPRAPDAEPVLLVLDRGSVQPTSLLVDSVAGIDAHHVDRIEPPGDPDEWELPLARRWFRAVVAEPDESDGPIGVFDLDAIVAEARDRS